MSGLGMGSIGGFGSVGMGMLSSVMKMSEGMRMQGKGQSGIDNFQWNDLVNPFTNAQISRQGGDLRSEQANMGFGTIVDAFRGGGTRGIMGGLGQAYNQRNMVNREVGANFDAQQRNIDMSTAQYGTKIQAMKEKRQTDELAGFGALLNQGMGMKYQGFADAANSFGALGQMGERGDETGGWGNYFGQESQRYN